MQYDIRKEFSNTITINNTINNNNEHPSGSEYIRAELQ